MNLEKSSCFIFPDGTERMMNYAYEANLFLETLLSKDGNACNDDFFFVCYVADSEQYVIVEIIDNKYVLERIK